MKVKKKKITHEMKLKRSQLVSHRLRPMLNLPTVKYLNFCSHDETEANVQVSGSNHSPVPANNGSMKQNMYNQYTHTHFMHH